jgi:succinate-semialdehyde dehydrogenase/glutarate-semialdehyde dehydrogenase
VYARFEAAFTERMTATRMGDPMEESTGLGPLATPKLREELHDQVSRSVKAGARLLAGGSLPGGRGAFYPPTVLADAPEGSPASGCEELFGPVATLFRARDATDALRIANSTPFGLGSSVWTRDESERRLFERGIEAGAVFFNALMASDPGLPFGGTKRSGIGRELSREGIREFTNPKTIWKA